MDRYFIMANLKLESLRQELAKQEVDAYILPTTDPHQSEYIPSHWKTREWLTGFTGSASTVVVTKNHAGLWTDSRYFVQAEQELERSFVLHKLVSRGPEYIQWILDNLEPGSKIAIHDLLFSVAAVKNLKKQLAAKQMQVVFVDDYFNHIWNSRTPLPCTSIYQHDVIYAGESTKDKVKRTREYLKIQPDTAFITTALDDIAWLLNIRGNDILYSPVSIAYLVIEADAIHLFIDNKKITDQINHYLIKQDVSLHEYDEVFGFFRNLKQHTKVLFDENQLNHKLYGQIPESCTKENTSNPITHFKAIKNATEIENYAMAQKRDGVAMCNLLHWIENHVQGEDLYELDISRKAEQFRRAQANFVGLSFETISAYGENAALPHYSPSSSSNKQILPKGILLIDSGGQYLDGTTDITRSIAVGEVSQEQIHNYTLVLKGHIRLSRQKFPYGTRGFQLDPLARMDLWEEGKEYGHGTGHGIGFCLNVHEGPQGISNNANAYSNTVFEPGMMTTNEPGYYKVNHYGIRIENVILSVEVKENLMAFETLTLCPYDRKLIDKSMLNAEEIAWINNYHKKVYETLAPVSCQEVKNWIKENTQDL